MKKTKILLYLFVSVIISLIIFRLLYTETNFFGGLNLSTSPEGIKQIAAITARDLNLKTENTIIKAGLAPDEGLISFVQDKARSPRSKKSLRDSLPVYRWNIDWSLSGVSGVNFTTGDQTNKKTEEYLKALKLEFDLKGRLLKFFRPLEDSVNLYRLSREDAKSLAENFISKYSLIGSLSLKDSSYKKEPQVEHSISYDVNSSGEYQFKHEKKIERLNRTDYEFSWADETNPDSIKKIINVSVSGNIVTSFSLEYKVNDKYYQTDNSAYRMLFKVLFYVVIFILLAVIAYKRIRAYEIGFRLAFILGAFTALCVGVEIYLDINAQFTWELLIPLILGPLFIATGVVLVWAASETITREVWKEKFISIDLATKGYILHSRVGSAIIKGLTYGFLISAGSLILLFIVQNLLGIVLVPDSKDTYKFFSTASPALSLLIGNVYASIFLVGVFFIFIVSGLKRRFPSTLVLVLICGLLWGIANIGTAKPFYFGILIETILGVAFVYMFIKTDVLVTLFALITYYTLNSAFSLFTVNNSFYEQSGYFILAVLLLTIIVSSISLFTKDKINEFDSITPAFAKNITERQRMQRELEIARDVQMSFLPKTTPSFSGLEVASQCVPALEVGGDYYDFVKINDDKFGIIIGDVSGKGTQAAFYMTLTKGFLKAISRTSESPSYVLSTMNELFYENVERGTFISMIYGIFDNEKKIFKLARAGHNPVIVKNTPGKIEMLNPTGLALGLEKGIVFSKTIKELEVPYTSGDVFIFYTDGFTEAMNKQKDEFGEERLISLVEKISNLSADEILNHIVKDVKIFMGNASQHDDMTMVVVKVN